MFNRVFNFNKNRSLQSGMPQVDDALIGWESNITIIKMTQNIVDGDVVFTETPITFLGTVQPLRDEQLQSQPEGMRSWEWIWIHCKAGSLNLQTQDKIEFNNKRYKVMGIKDYSLNGYIEYQLVIDYTE